MPTEVKEPLTDSENKGDDEYSSSQKISAHPRISLSNIDINIDDIHRSLNAVNTFSTKRAEKTHSILIYEITAEGESVYKHMTLRELLFSIHDEADEIDEEYFENESNMTAPAVPLHHSLGLSDSFAHQAKRLASREATFGDGRHPLATEKREGDGNKALEDSLPTDSIVTAKPFHKKMSAELTPEDISHSNLPTDYHSNADMVLDRHEESSLCKQQELSDVSHLSENRQSFATKRLPGRQGTIGRMDVSPNTHSLMQNFGLHYSQLGIPSSLAMDAQIGEDEIFEAVNIVRLRDLRRLDIVSNPIEEKSILVRRHAVIVAMDPIRAVVMARRLLLVVPDGADSLIGILDGFMKEWVDNYQRVKKQQDKERKDSKNSLNPNAQRQRSHSSQNILRQRKNIIGNELQAIIPFELHAYEALLMTVKELETQEFTFIHDKIQTALLYFKDAALVPIKIQSQLARLKNDLSVMINHVRGSRQALYYLTENDEEMSLMNLSLLKKKPKLYRYPLIPEIVSRHDEIEELIESYLTDFASLESKIEYIKSQIQSSEELVSLRLDTSRNELLIANTALAILSVAIAFGAYITGVFGMNLDQTIYIQPVNGTFAYVSSGSFGIMFIVFGLIFGYLRMTGVLPGKPQHTKKK